MPVSQRSHFRSQNVRCLRREHRDELLQFPGHVCGRGHETKATTIPRETASASSRPSCSTCGRWRGGQLYCAVSCASELTGVRNYIYGNDFQRRRRPSRVGPTSSRTWSTESGPPAIALTVRSFAHQRFAGCQIGGSPHPRENPPQAFRQPMQVSAIQTAQRIDEQPGMGAGRS